MGRVIRNTDELDNTDQSMKLTNTPGNKSTTEISQHTLPKEGIV